MIISLYCTVCLTVRQSILYLLWWKLDCKATASLFTAIRKHAGKETWLCG